jgi:hypothetical protein
LTFSCATAVANGFPASRSKAIGLGSASTAIRLTDVVYNIDKNEG